MLVRRSTLSVRMIVTRSSTWTEDVKALIFVGLRGVT